MAKTKSIPLRNLQTAGALLKKQRKAKGQTQKDLAKDLEISHVTIVYAEKGETRPNRRTLRRWVEQLNLPKNEVEKLYGLYEYDLDYPTIANQPQLEQKLEQEFNDSEDLLSALRFISYELQEGSYTKAREVAEQVLQNEPESDDPNFLLIRQSVLNGYLNNIEGQLALQPQKRRRFVKLALAQARSAKRMLKPLPLELKQNKSLEFQIRDMIFSMEFEAFTESAERLPESFAISETSEIERFKELENQLKEINREFKQLDSENQKLTHAIEKHLKVLSAKTHRSKDSDYFWDSQLHLFQVKERMALFNTYLDIIEKRQVLMSYLERTQQNKSDLPPLPTGDSFPEIMAQLFECSAPKAVLKWIEDLCGITENKEHNNGLLFEEKLLDLWWDYLEALQNAQKSHFNYQIQAEAMGSRNAFDGAFLPLITAKQRNILKFVCDCANDTNKSHKILEQWEAIKDLEGFGFQACTISDNLLKNWYGYNAALQCLRYLQAISFSKNYSETEKNLVDFQALAQEALQYGCIASQRYGNYQNEDKFLFYTDDIYVSLGFLHAYLQHQIDSQHGTTPYSSGVFLNFIQKSRERKQ